MKKYLKFIIILAVIIIVSVVAYIAVDSSKSSEEKELAEQGIVNICTFNSSDVSEMTVTDSTGTYEFVYEDSIWQWKDEDSAEFRCNTNKLLQMTDILSSLTSTKIVSETGENPEQYGFDQGCEIVCKTSDGEKYSVQIGSATLTNTGYYAKRTDEDTIYMISTENGDIVSADRNSLKSAYILDVNLDSVTGYRLERDGEVIFDVEKGEDSLWEISEPVDNMNVDYSAVSSISDLTIRVNSYQFVEENPSDLSKYGLDTPSHSIEIKTADDSSKVLFGDIPQEDTYGIYALTEYNGNSQVVIFPKESSVFKKVTQDILIDNLYGYQNSKVDTVDLVIEGQKVQVTVNKDNTYNFNGVEITDDERVKLCSEFFQSFNTAPLGEIDNDAEFDMTQEPSLEINYKFRDDTEEKSAFYKGENCYYFVRDGEYTGVTVSNDTITAIKASYAGIMNRVSEEVSETSEETTETENSESETE